MTPKEIGYVLLRARKRTGCSQKDYEKVTGIAYSTVHRIEYGKSGSLVNVIALAESLGYEIKIVPKEEQKGDG